MGMVWCKYQDKISEVLLEHTKWYNATIGICSIFFAGSCGLSHLVSLNWFQLGMRMICIHLFVIEVLLIIMRIEWVSPVMKSIGKRSMGLYVIHGGVMLLFRCEKIYIASDYLYAICIIAVSLLVSWLITPVFDKIYIACRQLQVKK